jgi:hypothetical protein
LTQRLSDYDVKQQQRLLDRDLELERRMADLDAWMDGKLASLSTASTANETCLSQLESAVISFDDWRPSMEGFVDDIRLHVSKLSKLYERSAVEHPTIMTGVLALAPSPVARPSAAASTAARPDGHYLNPSIRDDGCGVVTTLDHHPTKGVSSPSHPHVFASPTFHRSRSEFREPVGGSLAGLSDHLPKMPFPTFDGDQPKLWIRRCEDYFDLYSVDPTRWVRVSSMHFTTATSRWVQTVQSHLRSCSWSELCGWVLVRFGRDHHELLIRQLFHIRQTSSVSKYIDSFSSLVDQLTA